MQQICFRCERKIEKKKGENKKRHTSKIHMSVKMSIEEQLNCYIEHMDSNQLSLVLSSILIIKN